MLIREFFDARKNNEIKIFWLRNLIEP